MRERYSLFHGSLTFSSAALLLHLCVLALGVLPANLAMMAGEVNVQTQIGSWAAVIQEAENYAAEKGGNYIVLTRFLRCR